MRMKKLKNIVMVIAFGAYGMFSMVVGLLSMTVVMESKPYPENLAFLVLGSLAFLAGMVFVAVSYDLISELGVRE